jgi:predicted PurR-regulated permease PerM
LPNRFRASRPGENGFRCHVCQAKNTVTWAFSANFRRLVILPSTLITASLVQEASGVYRKFQSGELNLAGNFQQVVDALPTWAASLLDRFGLTNLAEVQERLSAALVKGSQFLAAQALNIGQITLELIVTLFIMLYLLFFLLRDGDHLFESAR